MKTTAAQYRLPLVLIAFLLVSTFIVTLLKSAGSIFSATANHIVISEVQIIGDADGDEFVELYNPTSSDILMENWRLTRKNSSGTEDNLVSDLDGTIPAHGYFLIGHGTEYNGSVSLDVPYSAPSNALTNNYTVLLYRDQAMTQLEDKVGFGTSADYETSSFSANPDVNGSIERKPGEQNPTAGNGEDTDNNANDFSTRTASEPQNTSSATETPPVPTVPVTPPITLYALLHGKNEVPPVDSPADGYASFIFDYSDNTFDLNLSAQYIALADLTGSHVHVGGIGEEGGIIVDLGPVGEWQQEPNDVVRRIIQDMEFPEEYIDELIAGNTYINLHTSDNPDGEIRGQLSTQWPPPDATISISPTPTISPTESPSPTVTPTEEPSPTVTPTEEPSPTLTPTLEPSPTESPTPTVEPSPTESVTPTVTPTEEPSPTLTPSPEPTAEPTESPTPTLEPTSAVTPTVEPSVTIEPTPTEIPIPTPTLSPTPTPQGLVIGFFNFPGNQTTCRLNFRRINFMWTFFLMPQISCSKASTPPDTSPTL